MKGGRETLVADRFMMLDERLCDDDEERYIGRICKFTWVRPVC